MKNAHYNTEPNDFQKNLIYRLALIGMSMYDIMDIVLFDIEAEKNPILFEDVEGLYLEFRRKNIYMESPEIIDYLKNNHDKTIVQAISALKIKMSTSKNIPTLLDLKKKKNVKNVEISKNCFISPMMLTHYEKLKRTPSFLNTLILSHYFETDFRKIKWIN